MINDSSNAVIHTCVRVCVVHGLHKADCVCVCVNCLLLTKFWRLGCVHVWAERNRGGGTLQIIKMQHVNGLMPVEKCNYGVLHTHCN